MRIFAAFGPMGCGKSAWLSQVHRQALASGKTVAAFVPTDSTRGHAGHFIHSRKGDLIEAEPVGDLPTLGILLGQCKAQVALVDEPHRLGRRMGGFWDDHLVRSGFTGDLYLGALSVGWDGEFLDPIRYLLQEGKLAAPALYLPGQCSIHGLRCQGHYSWKIDPHGPEVSDLRTPENPTGNYWCLCFSEFFWRYQARHPGHGPGIPNPDEGKSGSGFNLEMAHAAHFGG